jgi:hypothetical protein
MLRRILPAIAASVLLFASCEKKTEKNYGSDATRGYYPLNKGQYITYDVDSVLYDDFTGDSVQKHCQVRYTTLDTFTDNQNRLSYQVAVHKRNSDTLSWETSDVFFATPTATGLEVVQNNLRFLKLAFPVSNSYTWNATSNIATNDPDLTYFKDWMFKYSNKGNGYNNGRAQFDNTVIVDQIDHSLNIPVTQGVYSERTFGREVYAYDIGLVYREAIHWTYDQNGATPPVSAKKGWSVIMRAIDHN